MRRSLRLRTLTSLPVVSAGMAAVAAGVALYLDGSSSIIPAVCGAIFVFVTMIATLRGAIGTALTTVLIAGLCQALIATLRPVPSSLVVDDATFVALLIATVPLVVRARRSGVVCAVALDTLLVAAAATHSLSRHVAIVQSRQVLLPAFLILAGYLLGQASWRPFGRVVVGAGVLLATYAVLEVTVGHPINPTTSLRANHEVFVYTFKGLPGYYYYYGLLSHPIVRAGTFILNPPEAGLFLGLALVMSLYVIHGRWRWPVAALLAVGTLLTLSRGGILLALLGGFGPVAVRRFGRVATLGAAVAGIAVAAALIYEQAGAKGHVNGLGSGLTAAFRKPWGYGFGHFGDLAALTNPKAIGESSVGAFVGATGVLGIVLVLVLAYSLMRRLAVEGPLAYLPAVGLGALAAACFSESATALNATVALWLCTGRALTCSTSRTPLAPAAPAADCAGTVRASEVFDARQ